VARPSRACHAWVGAFQPVKANCTACFLTKRPPGFECALKASKSGVIATLKLYTRMAGTSKAVLITQNEPNRYIEKEKLRALLVKLFPQQADFKIRVRMVCCSFFDSS
jgi:hypothetical protein